MEQEFYSLMAYTYLNILPQKIYSKSVPADFVVPSIYFPRPFITESRGTLNSFSKTYTVYAKLFYQTSEEAMDKANELMDDILADRRAIPLLNIDGTPTDKYMKVSTVQVQEIEHNDRWGIAQISITWDSRYTYGREHETDYSKMGKFFLSGVID